MRAEDVCAIVVSFNGGRMLERSVGAVRGQVGHVHVVDNGSDEITRCALAELARRGDITITWFAENRGIAAALNAGVRHAREIGASWILTLDQDSTPSPGMIAAYAAAIAAHGERLVCLAPAVDGLKLSKPLSAGVRVVEAAITSGNLLSMNVVDRVGDFDESLFIDCVDFDYSLRVREAGYSIHEVSTALLGHELGDATGAALRIPFHTRHSPVRRYYMYRNCLFLARRHWKRFPAFVAKLLLLQAIQTFTIAAFGPERGKSLRLALWGVRDFAAGRRGSLSALHPSRGRPA